MTYHTLYAMEASHTPINSSPDVSPCRNCPRINFDKNECADTCDKLKAFRAGPVNLHIDRKAGIRTTFEPDPTPVKPPKKKYQSIPEGTICTVPECTGIATTSHLGEHYEKPLCKRCYDRFYNRLRRLGSIYLTNKPGEL